MHILLFLFQKAIQCILFSRGGFTAFQKYLEYRNIDAKACREIKSHLGSLFAFLLMKKLAQRDSDLYPVTLAVGGRKDIGVHVP